jgi:hypothetical protein
VVFPSSVIANVALTKGRAPDRALLFRNGFLFLRIKKKTPDTQRRTPNVEPAVSAFYIGRWALSVGRLLYSLRFGDFMFRRCHLALHFAQLHALGDATWFVEEVDNPAGQTAHNHDQKAE